MARGMALAALLALLLVCAEAREPSRRLHSYYSKSGSSSPDTGSSPDTSGSSPDTSSPYSKSGGSSPDTSSPSGSSPETSSPYSKSGGSSPGTSSPSGSSPGSSSPDTSSPYPKSGSSSSPDVSTPASPDTTTPTPDTSTPTPDTSSPTGGYGGYGAHAGCGTPKFWVGNPGRIPKLLSLLSTIGKLFGSRITGLLGHKTMLGAIKDESPEAFPSLAREGAASLINAYAYKDFPLSAMDVVKEFNSALGSADVAREQALKFQRLNEAL